MTLAIKKLAVPPEHRIVHQGQTVRALVYLESISGTVGFLYTTTGTVNITLYDPFGNAIFVNIPMTLNSTGIYSTDFETVNQPLGPYSATINIIEGNQICHLERIVIFKIVRLATSAVLPAFNFFAIKDQGGNIWYWYYWYDDELKSDPVAPSIPGFQPIPVTQVQIPYWLLLTDANSVQWYVYPSLDGTPLLSTTQPPIGFGVVGPYTLGTLNLQNRIQIATIGGSLDSQAV